jgi:hypothetical protein
MAYDASAGSIVLFDGGGTTPTTSIYNGSWHKVNTTSGPVLDSDFSMTYDAAGGYTLLFGGASHSLSNETWSFRNGSWTQLHPPTAPSPRYAAAMTYDSAESCVLLFGGIDSSGAYLNDTWTFANGTWTNITSVVAPPAREYAQLSDDPPDHAAVLFGGWPVDNHTWEFSKGEWIQTREPLQPPIVNRGGFDYDPAFGGAVLFGGSLSPGGGGENESWIFENNSWLQLHPSIAPYAREYVTMAFDPRLFEIVLFGGEQTEEDLWVFGAGVVTLLPSPSHDGTLEFDGSPSESYSAPTSIDLGFGNHSLTQTPAPWAVFSSWDSVGNVTLWGAHPPTSTETDVLGNGTITVFYTPHPSLTFLDDPSSCDGILLNGTGHASGSSAQMFEGNYSAVAPQCPELSTYLIFSSWSGVGNLSITDPFDPNTTVSIGGNATLIAHYVAQISLQAFPATDGSIQLNSSFYSGDSSLELRVGNYSLLPTAEPWGQFVRWTTLGGLSVNGGYLEVNSTGTLTAEFQFAPELAVGVTPASCGMLSIRGTGLSSGTSTQLPAGTYPILAPNCTGASEVFEGWVVTGGLSVSPSQAAAATLTVVNNGSLLAQFVPGYLVQFGVEGGDGGTILFDGTPVTNGSSLLLAAGDYPLGSRAGGSGFLLRGWQTSGEVHVVGGMLDIAGPGAVSAMFGPPNASGAAKSSTVPWGLYATAAGAVLVCGLAAAWFLRRRCPARDRTTE